MDAERIDGLAKSLATAQSRRSVLSGLLRGVAGGGLAIALARQEVGATVGGYVEIHNVACPPGYDPDDMFAECHGNRLPGVGFVADGPGPRHYEDVTDDEGRVVFGDFPEPGEVTIAQAEMTGDFADYAVFCSRVDTGEPIPVEKRANGRAAAIFELPPDVVDAGSGIVCDWYNLPAADDPSGSASIEIHESACPADVDRDALFEICHANGLAGVELTLQGPVSRWGTTAGPIGAVRFESLPAGGYTVAETTMTGDFAEYVVYCSDADGNEVPFVYRGDGRAAIVLSVGDDQQVVCDWFNIPAAHAVAPVADEAPNGGIGLSRAHWDEIHGDGRREGAVYTYEDGAYAVAFSDGVVTFVEMDWVDQGGLDPADATADVLNLLPADAELVQRYSLPATPDGPIGLPVERYQSVWLAQRLEHAALDWDGSVIVVYQQATVVVGAEPKLVRVSIAAGTRP